MPKPKKIKRHRSQVPLLLSTDISGIFSVQPDLFYQLFHTLSADCCPIDGVEFLPFRFSKDRVKKTLDKFNIPITGIHAPVAIDTPDRGLGMKLFVTPFSLVMPSLHSTLKLTSQSKANYLLFHEPDLDKCCVTKQLNSLLKKDHKQVILLENVYRPNSLKISVQKAKKLAKQTQAGVMIDLVHLLMEVMGVFSFFDNYHYKLNSKNIDRYWSAMLFEMDKALKQIPIAGLHIPIGTNRDSLPWEIITTKHWQQLAKILDKHQDRLVALTLENQHLETVISMNKKHLPQIIKDKKRKIKTLIKTRVL